MTLQASFRAVAVVGPPAAVLARAVADGAAAGWVLGAALGTLAFPVVGTIVGGAVGAWVGLLLGFGGGVGILLVPVRCRSTAALRAAAATGALAAALIAAVAIPILAGADPGPPAVSATAVLLSAVAALVVAAVAAALAPGVAGVGASTGRTGRFLRVFARTAAALLMLVALGGLLLGLRVYPPTAWVAPVEALLVAGPTAVALAGLAARCSTRTSRADRSRPGRRRR